MRQTKKVERKPMGLRSVILTLLVLLAIGTFIVLFQREKLDQMEYPRKYSEFVQYYADKYTIDPLLLYSFIRTESNFNPDVDSDAGARGLMQITEVTFEWIKSKIAPNETLTFEDLYDPETNIRFGSYFVAYCLRQYDGDIATAAAAYHSGLGTVNELLSQQEYSRDGRVLSDFPYRNMRQYVHKITHSYQRYQEIYAG